MVLDRKEKRCPDCSVVKPISEYNKSKSKPDGLQAYCKPCSRARNNAHNEKHRARVRHQRRMAHNKSRYGITPEEYEALLEKASAACMACGVRDERLCIDHSHKDGRVRGILCWRCNLALGYALDNPDVLVGLANYLRNS